MPLQNVERLKLLIVEPVLENTLYPVLIDSIKWFGPATPFTSGGISVLLSSIPLKTVVAEGDIGLRWSACGNSILVLTASTGKGLLDGTPICSSSSASIFLCPFNFGGFKASRCAKS